jgi:hypothetical protein
MPMLGEHARCEEAVVPSLRATERPVPLAGNKPRDLSVLCFFNALHMTVIARVLPSYYRNQWRSELCLVCA